MTWQTNSMKKTPGRLLGWVNIKLESIESPKIQTASLISSRTLQSMGEVEFTLVCGDDIHKVIGESEYFLRISDQIERPIFDSLNSGTIFNCSSSIIMELDNDNEAQRIDNEPVLREALAKFLEEEQTIVPFLHEVKIENVELQLEFNQEEPHSHILEIAVPDNYCPWETPSDIPPGVLGCFLCYSIHSNEKQHPLSRKIRLSSGEYSETRQCYSLWWDTEFNIFNGQNRHVFTTNVEPASLCEALGIHPHRGIELFLVPADEDGNFPSETSSPNPLAVGNITLDQLMLVLSKNQTNLFIDIALKPVLEQSSTKVPDHVTLRFCHIVKPFLPKISSHTDELEILVKEDSHCCNNKMTATLQVGAITNSASSFPFTPLHVPVGVEQIPNLFYDPSVSAETSLFLTKSSATMVSIYFYINALRYKQVCLFIFSK